MQCRKCRADIPNESKFCLRCGAKQEIKQNPKKRGNGQGSVFQRSNKSWIAIKTIGYEMGSDGKSRKITRSKSGFRTKKEALEYLPKIGTEARARPVTFRQVYDAWEPTHRASKSTMDCYRAAVRYFRWNIKITHAGLECMRKS